MDNLFSIIEHSGMIKLEISGEDLLDFSNQLINRTKEEFLSTRPSETKEEKYLTKAEAQAICGVCSATLWHWQRRKYLLPCKIGRKVMYKQSDIEKILNGNIEKEK